jgi:hypothetical protein
MKWSNAPEATPAWIKNLAFAISVVGVTLDADELDFFPQPANPTEAMHAATAKTAAERRGIGLDFLPRETARSEDRILDDATL